MQYPESEEQIPISVPPSYDENVPHLRDQAQVQPNEFVGAPVPSAAPPHYAPQPPAPVQPSIFDEANWQQSVTDDTKRKFLELCGNGDIAGIEATINSGLKEDFFISNTQRRFSHDDDRSWTYTRTLLETPLSRAAFCRREDVIAFLLMKHTRGEFTVFVDMPVVYPYATRGNLSQPGLVEDSESIKVEWFERSNDAGKTATHTVLSIALNKGLYRSVKRLLLAGASASFRPYQHDLGWHYTCFGRCLPTSREVEPTLVHQAINFAFHKMHAPSELVRDMAISLHILGDPLVRSDGTTNDRYLAKFKRPLMSDCTSSVCCPCCYVCGIYLGCLLLTLPKSVTPLDVANNLAGLSHTKPKAQLYQRYVAAVSMPVTQAELDSWEVQKENVLLRNAPPLTEIPTPF